MRRGIILGILLGLSPVVFCQTLTERIDTLIKTHVPNASVGIQIKDAQTGKLVYRLNDDLLFAPASSIKLFTAAATLYHFKPDDRFTTTLAKDKNTLYIQFNGSPSLSIDDFNRLLMTLKTQKGQTITGDIILDVSRFKEPYYSGGISYDDLGWYYAPPDTAVMLDKNAQSYEVISAKKIGEQPTIQAKEKQSYINIINQTITVSKEQADKHCALYIDIQPENTLKLYGCLAEDKNPRVLQLAITDPIALTKKLIRDNLKRNHIDFQGDIKLGMMPPHAQLLMQYDSDNIIQLITHMLHFSDNLYASTLTRQLGFALTQEGSTKQGVYAIKTLLKAHTNLDMSQIELNDGIGTRYNLSSPKQMVLLLSNLYSNKTLRQILFKALPQSGISGTLSERMKKTKLHGIIYAKTGTMHDISSLSGYMVHPEGRTLIFSIMINGINKPISVAKSLEEQILLAVYEGILGKDEPENAFG